MCVEHDGAAVERAMAKHKRWEPGEFNRKLGLGSEWVDSVPNRCRGCHKVWPCDAALLAAEVVRLREEMKGMARINFRGKRAPLPYHDDEAPS